MSERDRQADAVVLLSGGMDSCVCSALAVRDFGADSVAALHISYGQRTEAREAESFAGVCDRLGISKRMLLSNPALRQIGGSALTDESIAVPEVEDDGGAKMGQQMRVTYVVFTSAHFV